MNPKINIGGEVVAPGERRSLNLPLPDLYTHSSMAMPVHVVNGKRAGPCLFLSAAIHGDEINGVEVIRRVLRSSALNRLRGSLIAVPVVNVYGFVAQSRYLPDRRDLNRSFPGSDRGSLAARLARVFLDEIVANCSHGIDLHTAAIHRDNLPQIRTQFDDDGVAEGMARAFGAPVIINSDLRDGSLRHAVSERGVPVLVYEGGEALRFGEVAIRAGAKGVFNVMRSLGMLPKVKRRRSPIESFVARSSSWVRAPQSGILRSIAALGARVEKGELLGTVGDPFGLDEMDVAAGFDGIIIGRTNLPLANEGEALFHIARFKEPDGAAEVVEAFTNEMDPATDRSPPTEPPLV